MAEIMVRFNDLRRYCEDRHCGSVPLEYIKQMQTIEAGPVKQGKWTDDTTDVVCSNCKARFEYEMLIYIAYGIKAEFVDGMTCRCPKCGSYNRYGGEQDE